MQYAVGKGRMMAKKRKTNAELVAEAEAEVQKAQQLVEKRKKVLADRRRRASAEQRKRENHAKLRIGGEVLRWTGNDWSEFDFERFALWLAEKVETGTWRTEKLPSDDAWGRLRAWEGGGHMGAYPPAGAALPHEPAGIERTELPCPSCGEPARYGTRHCPACGAALAWSAANGEEPSVAPGRM